MEGRALLGRLNARVFRFASLAAFLAAALALLQVAIEIVALNTVGAPPTRADGWLELLGKHPVFAVTELTILQLPLFVLLIPVIGAICLATREADEPLAAIAFVLAVVGIAVFVATDPVLALLALSREYAAAASDVDRAAAVAAARALMALATTSVDVGTSILAVAWVMTAVLMRRTPGFAVATVGLAALAGIIGLIAAALDVFAGAPNILFLEIAGALMVLWLLMAARDLRRLGERGPTASGSPAPRPRSAGA